MWNLEVTHITLFNINNKNNKSSFIISYLNKLQMNTNNNIPKEKALSILNNIHSATGLGMTYITLSHFNYPESGKESNVYATSAFALKRSRSSKEDLENRLNILQFSDLIIFYIKRHLVKEAPYIDLDIASYNKTSSLKVVVIDYDYFFSKQYLKHLDILSNNDRGPCVQIVLITESLNWSLIKTGLKKHNINLNSGNNALKRVLSPNQFLLSKVIMLIYGFNTTLVERSFRYLARNKAFSGSLFDYTDKNNQIFVDSFPYGDSSCTSASEANNGSNNNNNSQSTNNNNNNYVSNNTTSDIKKETLGVSCRSNNSPAKPQKRGFHSKLATPSTLFSNSKEGLFMMRSFSTSLSSSGALKNYMIEQMDDNWDDYNLDDDTWMAPYLSDRKDADREERERRKEREEVSVSVSLDMWNKINKLDSIKKDKRIVDPRSGLYKKMGIPKWIHINYSNKLIPKPDMLFITSFIDFNYKKAYFSLRSILFKTTFRDFYYVSLYYYKLNNTTVKSNYYLYLINTPDNLLYSFCLEQIEYYYSHLYKRIARRNGNMFLASSKEYKYELLSLYHDLGKRLVWYCLKYMYTQYINHFKNLSITGESYKKYTITVLDKKLELDFFLSFTDFKNILIKELFDLDTGDLIKYGKDMYLFTLFNIFVYNSINNKIKDYNSKELKVKSKALVNVIKPNLGYLGGYYPSRNEMNKSIIKLDFNNIEKLVI